ncbi:hypothetical protein A9P82_08685 [Arachidicoccus ginsenosidimutans]|nr:hypothetical protein A9P82_08685 [Arachidicoccus sp. BS20]
MKRILRITTMAIKSTLYVIAAKAAISWQVFFEMPKQVRHDAQALLEILRSKPFFTFYLITTWQS